MKESLNFSIINIGDSVPTPQIKDSGYYKWIEWGDKNDFPQYLIDVYKFKSITHKAIINRKVDMLSYGFEDTLDPVVQNFIKNSFSNDNLEDILYKVSLDLLVMGGFALEVIWSKDGKKIAQIEHVPFENIRVDKYNNIDKTIPNIFYLSDNWRNRFKYIPLPVQGFSVVHKAEKRQIMWVSKYDAGKTTMSYPLVNWYSSLNYILSEWEISQFHFKNIINGFSSGHLINFTGGDVSDEEKQDVYHRFKEQFTGSYNTGTLLLNWSPTNEASLKIEEIPNNQADTKFIELNELIKSNIMTANGVTNSELFSYDGSGGVKFSSKDQIKEMLEVFQSICIDPDKNLIEKTFNKLLNINNEGSELKIKKYEI